METEDNPNLPQRLPHYAPIEAKERSKSFRKGVWVGVASLASAELAGFFIDRGFEVSGVKPNIVHACTYWFFAWLILSVLLWVWARTINKRIRLLVSSFPIVAIVIISLAIRPWVVEEYRAEHTPPDTLASDTYKAVTNLAADVHKTANAANYRASLPSEDVDFIKEALRNSPKLHVGLLVCGGSDDAVEYGRQVEELFRTAGFSTGFVRGLGIGSEGMFLVNYSPELLGEPLGTVMRKIAANSKRSVKYNFSPTVAPPNTNEGLSIIIGSR